MCCWVKTQTHLIWLQSPRFWHYSFFHGLLAFRFFSNHNWHSTLFQISFRRTVQPSHTHMIHNAISLTSPALTQHHTWSSQHHWPCSSCCTLHPHDYFATIKFVLPNPFTLFTQSPNSHLPSNNYPFYFEGDNLEFDSNRYWHS